MKRLINCLWTIVVSIPRVVNSRRYFPDRPQKLWIKRYLWLVIEYLKNGKVEWFYNAYGFDCVGFREIKDYITEGVFWNKIIKRNYQGETNYTIVLRDKLLFDIYMRQFGIPLPQMIGYSNASGCYLVCKGKVGFEEWKNGIINSCEMFFIKDAMSCCGRAVYGVKKVNGILCCDGEPFALSKEFIKGRTLIVQAQVKNCAEVDEINPYAVNTMRIITIVDKNGTVNLLTSGILRIGCNRNLCVDNISKGGVAVGVDEEGKLMECGYCRPKERQVYCYEHPVTGKKFKGVQIPNYEDACKMVKYAHSLLPTIPSIGWDVAFTTNGPCLIEGNDNWEISSSQVIFGGLRNKLTNLI